jgi:hypothetical protein
LALSNSIINRLLVDRGRRSKNSSCVKREEQAAVGIVCDEGTTKPRGQVGWMEKRVARGIHALGQT